MKKQILMLFMAYLIMPFTLPAQNCVDFESLALSAQFGNGINTQGEVIFTEANIPVTVEYFEWSSGGGTFGNCNVIDGMTIFGTTRAMFTSNINLGFDFSNIGFVPNKVVFDFSDMGGEENISVNGSLVYAGELMSAPMPPGILISFIDMGTFWRATLAGPVISLLIGGQEFALDNICASYIEDPSVCIDFEMLPPGAEFGNGINVQGEVIFTENGIPVSVEYFQWPGGGGTFGNANVINGSGTINSGQAMFTSNINLGFDFSDLADMPNWVSFEYSDMGGDENISVNGYPIYAGELSAAAMPPGFSLLITNAGTHNKAYVISQTSTISELIVGGQEFVIDNICPLEVGFFTTCVEFESQSLGASFGSGINNPGDVIFVENGIPVSVDEFWYMGGGSTFGSAEVTNSSGIGTGQDMREGNINLEFDFTESGFIVEMVTFDFADYGGHENIAVNDLAVFKGELMDATLPVGFNISVSMTGNIGQCVIQGGIVKLLIGGQEFFIDNVCGYHFVSTVEPEMPEKNAIVELGQNYPNPVNGQTIIPFVVHDRTRLTVAVYDYLGREISVLTNKVYAAGEYRISWDAGSLPDGIYFCRVHTGDHSQTMKMILLTSP